MEVSEIAPEYGLSVEENALLKIIILGADKSGRDKSSIDIWIIFIIITILIIIIILIIMIVRRIRIIRRRMRRRLKRMRRRSTV